MIIRLPEINVPEGCEAQAAQIFSSLKAFFNFTARPEVIPDVRLRTVTTGLEHALEQGALQARQAAAAAPKSPTTLAA